MVTQQNDPPCPPRLPNFPHLPSPPPPLPPPPPPPPRENVVGGYYGWDGIMLLAAIGCIFTVFITTVTIYYIYFRLCSTRVRSTVHRSRRWRREISGRRRYSWSAVDGYYFSGSPTNEGLRSTAVEALPVFVFKAEDFRDGMRCAVCLCDFQENEKGRSLPNCGHNFHVECIDMWFYSHATCPLCRQGAESVGEVEDWRAKEKVIMVSESGGSESQRDGVEERKEPEGERSGEDVAIGVSATDEPHLQSSTMDCI